MSKSERRSSPFDAAAPRVFSIDQGRPFLADLAEALIEALGADLPRAEVFLPTRRARRAAADAILLAYERRGVRAALLPRFRAIGDIDEDELVAFAGPAAAEIDLPPAVSPTDRLLALARLVAARDRVFAGQENWPAAIAAAGELGRLLDSFYTEEVDPAALRELDVGDIAGHWARSLKFLEIVTHDWPKHLAEIGRTDPADRRRRLIEATANQFLSTPPAHPLIVAGTTASAPAVARLVEAIARAPMGLAVLPGLDRAIDPKAFASIDDAHPQASLKALLDHLKLTPADISAFPGSGGRSPRARLLALALRPAEATDDWLALVAAMTAEDKQLAQATEGLALIEAADEDEEASVIAALFRMTIETPSETAMLVTPDRMLARRVALKMRRWNVNVDDSAGVPFANSPCGAFLRLAARFLDDPGDPVATLALLRHPHARLGLPPGARAAAVDALDRDLRGTRPPNGLETSRSRIAAARGADAPVARAIAALQESADAFERVKGEGFAARLSAHVGAAERLAGEDLWSGEDGETGAALLSELLSSAGAVDAIGGDRYPDIFDALIAGAVVRERGPSHPRLAILGPLEARMQSADHVILGGLNEGTWPAEAARDPFLSRTMRRALGLSSPERRIGLSAQDFAGLAAQPRVTLTRAKRADGAPATASRWLIRLRNLLTGAGAVEVVDRSADWSAIVARLDATEKIAPGGPPRPPAGPGRRPAELSVTRIETWLRDPYSIYAQYLLRLRKLEEPGAAFGAREMGVLLHKTLERAARAAAAPTPATLEADFNSLAPEFGLDAAERRFWSRAVADCFDWYCGFDAARRREGVVGVVEGQGRWEVKGLDPPFALTAKADRIDILKDGRAALFDYKLDRTPSERQIAHFSPQLPLTGAMVEAGAFAAIGRRTVASYAYQRLVNRKEKDAENALQKSDAEAAAEIRRAAEGLKAWIRSFDDPRTIYLSQPRPEFVNDYGDYDQLARRKEWGVDDDADGRGD
jgi:ATP-dependent helicase/nuclease subunit B